MLEINNYVNLKLIVFHVYYTCNHRITFTPLSLRDLTNSRATLRNMFKFCLSFELAKRNRRTGAIHGKLPEEEEEEEQLIFINTDVYMHTYFYIDWYHTELESGLTRYIATCSYTHSKF